MNSTLSLLLAATLLLGPPDAAQQDKRERTPERRSVQTPRERTVPQQRSVQPQRSRESTSARTRAADTSRFRTGDNRLGTVRNARPRDNQTTARPQRIDPNRMGAIRNNPVQRRLDDARRPDTARRPDATQRRITDAAPRTRVRDGGRNDWDRRVYNGRWQAHAPVRFGAERRWARPFGHRWGEQISRLPQRARLFDFGGSRYWVDRGVVYSYGSSGYYVTRPPIGLTLGYLPRGYSVYNFGGAPYYYYDNVWYRPATGINLSLNFGDDDDYEDYLDDLEDHYEDSYDDDAARFEVVQVPMGGMIEELPSPYETVTIDGQSFFRAGDLYFVQVLEGSRVMYLRVDPWQRS